MKILLCGSSGFLGKNIKAFLEGRGHNVVSFDLSDGNDMTDGRRVRVAVADVDVVFHFGAAAVGRRNLEKNPRAGEMECMGVKNFAEACMQYSIPLVYASSVRVYRNDISTVMTEEMHVEPEDPYGRIKVSCEEIIQDMGRKGLRFAILRFAAVYGQGMPHDFIFSLFIRALKEGKNIELLSSPKTERNFLHVDDITDVLERILRWNFQSNEVFNIVHDRAITLEDLVQKMAQAMHVKYVLVERSLHAPVMHENISNKKIKDILGWRPLISIEDGISRLLVNSVIA